MATLEKVGEFAFIDAISRLARRGTARRGVAIGIGDDCAVVTGFPSTLLTTDTLMEDVHFRRGWLTPRQLGRRAFRVAVSDIAAMGGLPRYALLSLVLPASYDARDAHALVAAVIVDAGRVGTSLVGGNVSRGERICIGLTLVGDGTGGILRRDRARRGHGIYLTGPVGAAAAGVELLARGVERGPLVDAYRRPPLRVALARGLARSGVVSSMIDVSDGVTQDLGHLCRASEVSAVIDCEALPMKPALGRFVTHAQRPEGRSRRQRRRQGTACDYALSGGEDYELLLTAPPTAERRLARLCADSGAGLFRIGDVVRGGREPMVMDRDGRPLRPSGFDHFRAVKR